MLETAKTAVILFAAFTVITGGLYPLGVTAIAQLFFPVQANGSVILKDRKPIGSALIGQQFDDPRYFRGRPSSTTAYPYNASSSSGSNMGQDNPTLLQAVKERAARLRAADPANTLPIPVDLVTSSGSGLDPHISPEAAAYQVSRISKERGIDEAELSVLVEANTDERMFGIFGEPGVNVLKLNLALDHLVEK